MLHFDNGNDSEMPAKTQGWPDGEDSAVRAQAFIPSLEYLTKGSATSFSIIHGNKPNIAGFPAMLKVYTQHGATRKSKSMTACRKPIHSDP
ncbi:hypothetical protein EV1_012586 [Malus domestica]|uniref:Uncharacterized protein n=1 Tax=Malus baccata TaxID=106549 RepID=A0A540N7R2_MALBA|nr:hypothetical protein C1H46_007285 [Malus baccata]